MRLERIAAYASDPGRLPEPAEAMAKLHAAEQAGFERLLREQRSAWGRRWSAADVRIEKDPLLQRDVRFALFHLMSSVGESGETALGARGVSGPGYRGHVFWDTDIFVLPFLAATRPEAARTILEYRIRRLPVARAAARALGRAGARFPWESARTGRDVTPSQARLRSGEASRSERASSRSTSSPTSRGGRPAISTGPATRSSSSGRVGTCLVETARYWASRIRVDRDGRGHIDGVIGPDEYHEAVDDNAFTNVMARWNLRRAAALARSRRARARYVARARGCARRRLRRADRALRAVRRLLQLEPLVIDEIAPRRPVAADLLLGRERLHGAQVVKQADVLMLHHLVPDEVARDSLMPNLEFYEPRTAHGSSLSPGDSRESFARAGMLEQAVDTLRLTSRIDLDDVTQTTASGLQLATMGGVWQALAFGFAGIRPDGTRCASTRTCPRPGARSSFACASAVSR